jgi:hypothetical protein
VLLYGIIYGEAIMPFDPKIDDVKTYNHRMEKSLIDKIFWVDKVDSSIIVDYGCADGVLLKALQKLFPDYTYIGYDILGGGGGGVGGVGGVGSPIAHQGTSYGMGYAGYFCVGMANVTWAVQGNAIGKSS